MTSALVSTSSGPDAPPLQSDLEAAGIHVLGALGRDNLVREGVSKPPGAELSRLLAAPQNHTRRRGSAGRRAAAAIIKLGGAHPLP